MFEAPRFESVKSKRCRPQRTKRHLILTVLDVAITDYHRKTVIFHDPLHGAAPEAFRLKALICLRRVTRIRGDLGC